MLLSLNEMEGIRFLSFKYSSTAVPASKPLGTFPRLSASSKENFPLNSFEFTIYKKSSG